MGFQSNDDGSVRSLLFLTYLLLKDTIGQPLLGKPQTDETFLFSVSQ